MEMQNSTKKMKLSKHHSVIIIPGQIKKEVSEAPSVSYLKRSELKKSQFSERVHYSVGLIYITFYNVFCILRKQGHNSLKKHIDQQM